MKKLLFMLVLCLPVAGFADDGALASVLARARHDGAGKFQYRETRLLELAASPWEAEGYMLTGADGSLVKLQLQPSRVIMAISDEEMYYWDPLQNQRHRMPLDYGGEAAEQIVLFRAILQGHSEDFQNSYDFAAQIDDKRWSLRMTPKAGQGDAAATIEISGDDAAGSRIISMRRRDGEATEYRISRLPERQADNLSIPALLREATGD